MAAEVSSNGAGGGRGGGGGGGSGKLTAGIVTRDLLGGCSTLDSKELDLDLQVPSGWEKRLDLKSGKVFLQRCNSTNSSSSTSEQKQKNNSVTKFQDLNYPPASKSVPQSLNFFDDIILDLKLVSSSPSPSTTPSSSNYQSVCTLDKVKSALERAEKETMRKRSISNSSNSSSSVKDSEVEQEDNSSRSGSFAAGCPSCLLYVLISKSNPKCPRCNTFVPSPLAMKKPRIDLNISI